MPGGMSGPATRRGRRMADTAAPTTRITATPEARPMRRAPRAERPTSGISGATPASSGRPAHAERPLGSLVDGVGSPRRSADDRGGVHRHGRALHGDPEPVQAGGGGPQRPFAGAVVLRAVAGALEPLALLAEGHPAAQVGALLVDGHEPLGGDPRVERLCAGAGVVDHVEAALAVVERLPGLLDLA